MEDICTICKKLADFSCTCDNSLRFCSNDYDLIHINIEGHHQAIDLRKKRQEINQKFNSIIESLHKLKSEIVKRSNQFIRIIQLIVMIKLSSLKKNIDACKNSLKKQAILTDNFIQEFQNMKLFEPDFKTFIKITAKNFTLSKDESEVFYFELEKYLKKYEKDSKKNENSESNPERLQKFEKEFDLESKMLYKNIIEFKKKIELTFNLFLEVHTS